MSTNETICGHFNEVIDEREGTVICIDCGLVLSDKNFHVNKFEEEVNGNETSVEMKIKDLLDKLNLPECFLPDIMKKYTTLQNKKYLLEYILYDTLNESGFPISIKELSSVSGIPDAKIYDLQKNDKSIILLPENLLEKYCKLLELDYKTYSLIKKELPKEMNTGHNPLTIIASTIYKFSKTNKLKLSMKHISNVLNISPISIQRYLKKKC